MVNSVLDWWSQVSFYWPWMGVLILLPLVYMLARRWLPQPNRQDQYRQMVRVPNLTQWASPQTEMKPKLKTSHLIWFILLWSALVVAAMRPQYIVPPQTTQQSFRDLVLVLDVSGSMSTEDMIDSDGNKITRMQAMQSAVSEFITQRDADRIGLIVFGSKAYPFAPLSRDHLVLQQRVRELQPAMAGPQTSIGDALGSTIKMYQDQEALTQSSMANQSKIIDTKPDHNLNANSAKNDKRERMVVLLTDGKDTASTLPPEVALRLAKQQHMTIHTIALGGKQTQSTDTELLKKIANQTGGVFYQVSDQALSLQQVYQQLNQLKPHTVTVIGWSYHQPLYIYPLAFALILLMLFVCATQLSGRVSAVSINASQATSLHGGRDE